MGKFLQKLRLWYIIHMNCVEYAELYKELWLDAENSIQTLIAVGRANLKLCAKCHEELHEEKVV